MMPDDWKAQIGGMDAILFGAVGWPATVPDHVSLWGSLLKFRREFDQYINLRPARLFDGVPCPLAGRKAGEIDMLIVRENTEGEYSSVGGVMFGGTAREFVLQESVFTRHGSERLLNYAFNLARSRARKHVTVATKSNGIAISMPWWDERAAEAAARFPDISWDKQHIDILAARFVLQPQRFDVVAATNLFGDILSDLGPACTGTIGIAPSANLNPERNFPSLFEPVHGSAPDIYGKNIANPVAMIWSVAMMLDFLGHRDAHDAILRAIETVLRDGPKHGRPGRHGRHHGHGPGAGGAGRAGISTLARRVLIFWELRNQPLIPERMNHTPSTALSVSNPWASCPRWATSTRTSRP
jgi:tartrate dehydrogenase/decarboxylase/D-malate dehydrogenase